MQTTTTITVTGDNDDCVRRFDNSNVRWSMDQVSNRFFLDGITNHMQNILRIRGYLFLNDFFDALKMERIPMGQVLGWLDLPGTSKTLVDVSSELVDGFYVLTFKPHGIIINDIPH